MRDLQIPSFAEMTAPQTFYKFIKADKTLRRKPQRKICYKLSQAGNTGGRALRIFRGNAVPDVRGLENQEISGRPDT
ncbi:hypothetical protein DENIS_3124 [Desulfonema ishimotonii]|uniref:Uncharacterized protein n=1 Tax=Desulfonema ishimotonii TaxID=45657 RepID=A0A401FYW5_9BACT|nr:hypothetical protein DENIS_3124 [Desulfonema ishimotonii]